MRLSKIKLAGFKSFVDPTTIPFPSNLIGVVGPNGCGKSNVIDAVRWVMGESSAKNLRGESMSDVIFNGSNTRKPVGKAMIELVFDNSDNTIGGQYAQYDEISIKRTVTRDGQSQYYQNGTRCRRRDITDIFLGTGLGPRSYSIIEQGMISRIIESKPEELRVFLEEAAGISKYKERRKETETRIRHTRDNMNRLDDLRDELGKQLDRLQRQSKTAEKYKNLKEEERLLKGQLTALKWRSLDGEVTVKQSFISEQETLFEAAIARLRGIESDIERQREQHIEASEQFNEIQGQFYGAGADIARVEQSIQHAKERRQEQQGDLKEIETSWYENQAHLKNDKNRLVELNESNTTLQPELDRAKESEAKSQVELDLADKAMHSWQSQWDEVNEKVAQPSKSAEVCRTKLQHTEDQLTQRNRRKNMLREENSKLNFATLEQEIATFKQQYVDVAEICDELKQQLEFIHDDISFSRSSNQALDDQLNEKRSQLQTSKGRLSSLEALQQAALGKESDGVVKWMDNNGLSQAKRLAEYITVEQGWESAVECVLGQNLEAVCVDGIDPLVDVLNQFGHGSLSIFDTHASSTNDANSLAVRLHNKINAPWSIDSLMCGVYCVDDLALAVELRANLAAHESVVTRDGIWLGRSWLKIKRDDNASAGILQREQEIQLIKASIDELTLEITKLSDQLASGREQLQQLEDKRGHMQSRLQQENRTYAEVGAKVRSKQDKSEHIKSRIAQIEQELAEMAEQDANDEQYTIELRQTLDEAIKEMQDLATNRQELVDERDVLRNSLEQKRTQARQDRDSAHEIAIRIQTIRTEISSITQNQERMEKQISTMSSRRDDLIQALEESTAPIASMQEELEQLLNRRVKIEARLTESRQQVEALDHDMREKTTARHGLEQESEQVRAVLDKARLASQEILVRRQTLEESLAETEFVLEKLFEDLPKEASLEEWQEKVEKVAQRITRLGPINLAAIEEYQQQSERKEYLDAQNEDLADALNTLENAIRKIDKETRQRFKETYEKVNEGFKTIFPKLFGGGHSYLELTGEDLLDTGVSVMARPPGKRNSSIHLLSGGEKAMTAVALVFAIFQLNPAPFCMLDEVDAPLDDANVGRFCKMVVEMSEHVQFIFITHNKITMEISHQLNGVTMHEPGVSRIVSVDVADALDMSAVG